MDIFTNIYFYIGLVIIFVLLVIFVLMRKASGSEDTLQTAQLVEYLGGVDNIVSVQGSLSKINVKVVEPNNVNIEGIKSLGASGVVETNKGFTFIFGNISQELAKAIEDTISK